VGADRAVIYMVKETGHYKRQIRTNSLSSVSELKKIFSPTKLEKRPKMAMRKFLTTATQVLGESTGLTNKSPPSSHTSTVRLTLRSEDSEDRSRSRAEDTESIDITKTPEWLSAEVDAEIERAATQAEETMDETNTTKRGRTGSSDDSRGNSPVRKRQQQRQRRRYRGRQRWRGCC